MDNGSRNIVTFIATITVAILLFMGAQFWAQSPDSSGQQNIAQDVAKQPAQPAAVEPALTETEEVIDPFQYDEFSESGDLEQSDKITGEPSHVIETNNEAGPTEG